MKKLLCCVIALALMSLLAACGGSTQPQGQTPPSSTPSTQTPGTSPGSSTPGSSTPDAPSTENPDAAKYGGIVRMSTTRDLYQAFGLVYSVGPARHEATCFSDAMLNITQGGEYVPHIAESWDVDLENRTTLV